MTDVTVYGTSWCADCRRTKQFLRERGVPFKEIDVNEVPDAEELVLRVNKGSAEIPYDRRAWPLGGHARWALF